mgnify:CR=1 FL=1
MEKTKKIGICRGSFDIGILYGLKNKIYPKSMGIRGSYGNYPSYLFYASPKVRKIDEFFYSPYSCVNQHPIEAIKK